MEVRFSQFCRDGQLRAALRPHIDRCAERGECYEFPRCRMPEGCFPSHAVLGFFRREDGRYIMYWRPLVAYRGSSRVLELLFRQCLWSFDSFAQLSSRLESLHMELSDPPLRAAHAAPPVRDARRRGAPGRTAPAPSGSAHCAPPWPADFLPLRRCLQARICGQDPALDAAAWYLCAYIHKRAPARPLSLILHGPTGVGKSELAKGVAPVLEQLCHERWQFVWTELNTFTQPHSIHRLTGAPPGYVGYEDEPVLSAVRKNPRTVFMFDELDKAHPDVWKIFMSVLDEGRCSVSRVSRDGQRELDYRRCIFLFTTNLDLSRPCGGRLGFSAAAAETRQALPKEAAATPEALVQQLFADNELGRKALIRHGVLQEIAGRFTGFIGFRPLTKEAQQQILTQKAVSLGTEYGLCITAVSPEAAAALLPEGNVTSIRSAICLLEARLAPVYQQAADGNGSAAEYHLTAGGGALSLEPALSGIRPLSADTG